MHITNLPMSHLETFRQIYLKLLWFFTDCNKFLGQIFHYPSCIDYLIDLRRVDYLCLEAVMHSNKIKFLAVFSTSLKMFVSITFPSLSSIKYPNVFRFIVQNSRPYQMETKFEVNFTTCHRESYSITNKKCLRQNKMVQKRRGLRERGIPAF